MRWGVGRRGFSNGRVGGARGRSWVAVSGFGARGARARDDPGILALWAGVVAPGASGIMLVHRAGSCSRGAGSEKGVGPGSFWAALGSVLGGSRFSRRRRATLGIFVEGVGTPWATAPNFAGGVGRPWVATQDFPGGIGRPCSTPPNSPGGVGRAWVTASTFVGGAAACPMKRHGGGAGPLHRCHQGGRALLIGIVPSACPIQRARI